MPIRMRNLASTTHYFRYFQPTKGGNVVHLSNYAFYLRDPVALIGSALLLGVIPAYAIAAAYRDYRAERDISTELRGPFTGYNIRQSQRGDFKEPRYGDFTDVGAIYETHYADGSIQQTQTYPEAYERHALLIAAADAHNEQRVESVRALQEKLRADRQREWLRLNPQN